jgi:hypothetical protein
MLKQTPTQKKVVAFGGSGKTVALIYIKLCNLTGYHPNVVVVDFPPGQDPNANDGKLDEELAAATSATVQRISTLPDHLPLQHTTISNLFNLNDEIADALFTDDQQRTPPVRGLNAEPQVGACVAQLKLQRDGGSVRSAILGQQHVYFVAGLGGGTGAGVTHQYAKFISGTHVTRHGVFVLPWRDIGSDGTVSNAQQFRNAASVLSYLKDKETELYTDIIIIGGSPGMELYQGDTGEHRAIYPSLILAALYLILDDAWGADANLTMPRRRLETPTEGITPQSINTAIKDKTLYDMLVLSKRRIKVMRDLADENPDQVLCFLSLAPLTLPLACTALLWILKRYARRINQRDYGVAWHNISSRLKAVADEEQTSLSWILGLLADKRVFKFDPNQLDRDAQTNYDVYLKRIKSSSEYKDFDLPTDRADDALAKTAEFIKDDMITSVLLSR